VVAMVLVLGVLAGALAQMRILMDCRSAWRCQEDGGTSVGEAAKNNWNVAVRS